MIIQVNKKQSYLDNNLKHEIEKYHTNLNKILNRSDKLYHHKNTIELNFESCNSNNNSNSSNKNEILCSYCLHRVNLALDHVLFNSKYYHCNCINFWLNVVDSNSLPDLRLPLHSTTLSLI